MIDSIGIPTISASPKRLAGDLIATGVVLARLSYGITGSLLSDTTGALRGNQGARRVLGEFLTAPPAAITSLVLRGALRSTLRLTLFSTPVETDAPARLCTLPESVATRATFSPAPPESPV